VASRAGRGGRFRVEVAEVWAAGYRKDSEVYAEIAQRVDDAGPSPTTKAHTDVLALFTKQARDLTATPEPEKPEPVPTWLTDGLLYVVHLSASLVAGMSLDESEKAWTAHVSGPESGS
jgi:hypothetical protein